MNKTIFSVIISCTDKNLMALYNNNMLMRIYTINVLIQQVRAIYNGNPVCWQYKTLSKYEVIECPDRERKLKEILHRCWTKLVTLRSKFPLKFQLNTFWRVIMHWYKPNLNPILALVQTSDWLISYNYIDFSQSE